MTYFRALSQLQLAGGRPVSVHIPPLQRWQGSGLQGAQAGCGLGQGGQLQALRALLLAGGLQGAAGAAAG